MLRSLAWYLPTILQQFRAEHAYARYAFDQIMLLGDLATFANASAYELLEAFVTKARWEENFEGGRIEAYGLGLQPGTMLPIPGNHDKLFRSDLALFTSRCTKRLDTPTISPGSVKLVTRQIASRTFDFIIVEASAYTAEPLTLKLTAGQHLARGEITSGHLEQLEEVGPILDSNRQKNHIQILVLHYAADLTRANQRWPNSVELVLPHGCDNIERLFDALSGRGHFAIHGHLHVPHTYSFRGIPVVSVASATQKRNRLNGIAVIRILKNERIFADHHLWNGDTFQLDGDLTRPLN
jgi:hypothetical protein